MDMSASQLEVAVLDRARDHRTFRRLTGARLEALLAEVTQAKAASQQSSDLQGSGEPAGDQPNEDSNDQGGTQSATPDAQDDPGSGGGSGS
jgi:proteasome alpha subunit